MDDNHLRLETTRDDGDGFGGHHSLASVDYDIVAPVGSSVDIHTVSGDVNVHGTEAGVQVQTVSGDVSLTRVNGEVRITTTSGDVQANEVEGVLSVQSTNGDVHLGRSRLSEFNIHSTNGDFHMETPLTSGRHYFAKTVNGDVTLSVPPGTGATVQLRTLNGDVGTSMPVEIINNSRRNWQGRINGGGATVEMESLNGDLHIRESTQTSVASAPEPAFATASPFGFDAHAATFGSDFSQEWAAEGADSGGAGDDREDTVSILARLEQGELSVEDAMARLDALRR
jgi:hypothetical protein